MVLVGFNASSYTVDEDANQVQVCVRLVGTAELAQPVQMRVSSSKDGTATGDYVAIRCEYVRCSIPFTQMLFTVNVLIYSVSIYSTICMNFSTVLQLMRILGQFYSS